MGETRDGDASNSATSSAGSIAQLDHDKLQGRLEEVVNQTLLQSRDTLVDGIAASLWRSEETRERLKPLVERHRQWRKRQEEKRKAVDKEAEDRRDE